MSFIRKPQVKVGMLMLAATFMLGSVAASEWFKPSLHWSDAIGTPVYTDLMPMQFGAWQARERQSRVLVNPVQEDNLMRLYTETLARTYVHQPTGRIIMLSVAYGKDQSTDTQLHTPDQCYPSQGFRIEQRQEYDMRTPWGTIPAVRLQTTRGAQHTEPVTYFIRVGDGLARGSKDRNLARLQMATKGYLVDGMLFRVSEATKRADSFELQEQFILELLDSIGENGRRRVIGRNSGSVGEPVVGSTTGSAAVAVEGSPVR